MRGPCVNLHTQASDLASSHACLGFMGYIQSRLKMRPAGLASDDEQIHAHKPQLSPSLINLSMTLQMFKTWTLRHKAARMCYSRLTIHLRSLSTS